MYCFLPGRRGRRPLRDVRENCAYSPKTYCHRTTSCRAIRESPLRPRTNMVRIRRRLLVNVLRPAQSPSQPDGCQPPFTRGPLTKSATLCVFAENRQSSYWFLHGRHKGRLYLFTIHFYLLLQTVAPTTANESLYVFAEDLLLLHCFLLDTARCVPTQSEAPTKHINTPLFKEEIQYEALS